MQIKTAVKRYFAVEPHISILPDNFCLQPKRMYSLLHIKATLFINFCYTVIVSTWVVFLKSTTENQAARA